MSIFLMVTMRCTQNCTYGWVQSDMRKDTCAPIRPRNELRRDTQTRLETPENGRQPDLKSAGPKGRRGSNPLPALAARTDSGASGRGPWMIEFEVFESGSQRRVYLVQVGSIATISPAGNSGTLIVLSDGRQLSAAVPYPRVREAVLTVRNQFV
jgi:hypothetical protein